MKNKPHWAPEVQAVFAGRYGDDVVSGMKGAHTHTNPYSLHFVSGSVKFPETVGDICQSFIDKGKVCVDDNVPRPLIFYDADNKAYIPVTQCELVEAACLMGMKDLKVQIIHDRGLIDKLVKMGSRDSPMVAKLFCDSQFVARGECTIESAYTQNYWQARYTTYPVHERDLLCRLGYELGLVDDYRAQYRHMEAIDEVDEVLGGDEEALEYCWAGDEWYPLDMISGFVKSAIKQGDDRQLEIVENCLRNWEFVLDCEPPEGKGRALHYFNNCYVLGEHAKQVVEWLPDRYAMKGELKARYEQFAARIAGEESALKAPQSPAPVVHQAEGAGMGL